MAKYSISLGMARGSVEVSRGYQTSTIFVGEGGEVRWGSACCVLDADRDAVADAARRRLAGELVSRVEGPGVEAPEAPAPASPRKGGGSMRAASAAAHEAELPAWQRDRKHGFRE